MNEISVFPVSIIAVMFSIFLLYVGSRSVLSHYKDNLEKDNKPKPDEFSFSFSAGSAFVFFFVGILPPVLCFLESKKIISMDMLAGIHLPGIIFTTTSFAAFVFLVVGCEWLLRRIARRREPEIQFEWFLWLK